MRVLGHRQRGHGLLHGRCQRRGAFEGRNVRQQRRGQVHGRYQRDELVGVFDRGRLQGLHEGAVRQRPAGRGEPGLHGSASGHPDYRQEVGRVGILGGLQRGHPADDEGLRARLHESRRLRSEEQQDVLLPVPVCGSHQFHRSRPAVPARILRNARNAELAEDGRLRCELASGLYPSELQRGEPLRRRRGVLGEVPHLQLGVPGVRQHARRVPGGHVVRLVVQLDEPAALRELLHRLHAEHHRRSHAGLGIRQRRRGCREHDQLDDQRSARPDEHLRELLEGIEDSQHAARRH